MQEKGHHMELEEILEKVGKNELKEALECEDPEALQKLLAAHGVKLSDEQLDFIAGGRYLFAGGNLGCTSVTEQ